MEKSYNGWTASPNPADFGGIAPLVIAGESFAPGVRRGAVWTVLRYVAEQLHARVEPIVRPGWHQADDWGYSYRPNRNANNLSCHASGTAIDYNATRHPNGKGITFTKAQVEMIQKILGEVDNVVRWGGTFTGTLDEMHFEVCKDEAAVEAVAQKLAIKKAGEEIGVALTPDDIDKVAKRVLEMPVKNMNGDLVSIVQILNGLESRTKDIQDKVNR